MKAKKRLKNFDFSGENAHMALVHEDQGGPATGIRTLITKAVDIGAMTDAQKESLKQIIKSANGFSEEEAQEYIEQLSAKDAGGESPVSDIEKGNVADNSIQDKQEKPMSEMIEKSAVEALIQKAVAEKERHIEELTKSLAKLEAEKAEAKKAEYLAKAADFEVLGVEDKESFGVALMKMAEQEELADIMSVLEKAVQIAKGVEGLAEIGHDLEPEEEQISGVMKAIKARKTSK